MEMHQVRYFLAVARVLNFTRAAEECNVAQPSLTRAIRQLEDELGGDLFRRERPHAIMTELGERMLPLLRQCYDSAISARTLASSIKSGDVGALRLVLSRSVDLSLIVPQIHELQTHFSNLELKLLRGTGAEVAETLKKGQAELAIAASIGDAWERLDSWPLFTEEFSLLVHAAHPLARRETVDIADLRDERLLVRSYCEHAEAIAGLLRDGGIDTAHGHEVASERDLIALIEASMGVAIVPRSAARSGPLKHAAIKGLDINRTVFLYGVAGRQRTAVASAIMKMLRGANWAKSLSSKTLS
jgi:DNA-binding transcriptional LysR family regulator